MRTGGLERSLWLGATVRTRTIELWVQVLKTLYPDAGPGYRGAILDKRVETPVDILQSTQDSSLLARRYLMYTLRVKRYTLRVKRYTLRVKRFQSEGFQRPESSAKCPSHYCRFSLQVLPYFSHKQV